MRTRLRSKVTLLFIVCAALLAVGGTALALTTDTSGSTSSSPTVQSDKADYKPGETVTLTGSNWQPGETVHLNVNDDEGQTWNRSVDVTADDTGAIRDQFQLPNSFVAVYNVTATGAQSGVATTSFTDGNVSILLATDSASVPGSWSVTWARYASTSCAGSPSSTGTAAGGTNVGAGNDGFRVTDVTPPAGYSLVGWSTTAGGSAGSGNPSPCIAGNPGGDLFAHFKVANQAPVAQSQPLSTNEDTAKTITLSGTDADGNNLTFAIVSGPTNGTLGSIGAVSCTGTAPKTCSANVTYTPNNNYNGGDLFTFKVNDGTVDSNTAGVPITVNPVNDAPSFTKGANETVNEDSGAHSVTGWATAISKGPADENGQTLDFQVTNNNNALFTATGQPQVSANGTLSYTLAADANGTATVDVKLHDNGGTANGGVDTSASQTFTITVNSVNDAPSFTKGANQTVNEDAAAQTVNGWATAISAGPNESGQTVQFIVTNDNNGLFTTGGQPAVDSSGKLTYTPAADKNGSATVTIKAKDNGGTANGGVDESASQTFTITINSVNDAPSFTKGADQTVNEDSGAHSVTGWATAISAGPADENGQTVNFQVTNDNNSLFSAQPSVAANGTLSYTPAANAHGNATVTIKAKDSGGTGNGGVDESASQTFTITINSVNDAPSFTKGADQTKDEDAGAQSVPGWATDISAGPNESGQALNFIVTNDNNALFSTQPSVAANGTLSYTPANNANGTAQVTVKLHDDGGTANGGVDESASQTFTITINSVNDAPSFTKGADQTVNEDSGAHSVTGWATAISAGPADENGQALDFIVTNNNSSLFTSGGEPQVSASGDLSYTLAANAHGNATVTVKLHDDGGTANGGVDESASQTFTITVNSVNDAPSFTKGADQTKDEDAGAQSVPGWATNISKGPADENGQTLDFIVTNNNNALFTATGQPQVSASGDLTYTLAANAHGNATVTVKLHDNGGTANGGVDTSAAQTFTITIDSVNDNPVITAVTNDGPRDEGSPATITVTANDEADGDTLSYEFDCNNDNTFEVGPLSSNNAQCTFNDEGTGTYTVNVRVSDGNGGTATGSTNVVVKNVNPTIGPLTVTGNSGTACLGSTNVVNLSFSITDPGTADTHSGTINWGDGATTTFTGSSVTQQHPYSAGGPYTITVTASDNDGGNAVPKSTTGSQNVSLLYKVSEFQDPVNPTGMTMSVFKWGSTIPLKVIITDCNNQPVNGLVPKISFTKVNPATPVIGVNEALSTQPNDTNFLMRDAGNGQYIYNLNTKTLADGDATYNAKIEDSKTPATYGPKVTQNFGLRSK